LRRSSTLLLACCCLWTGAAATPPEPALLEKPGGVLLSDGAPPPEAGDRGFDVLHYALDIALDPGGRRIDGTVVLQIAFPAAAPDTLRLDLDDVHAVSALTWDGRPVDWVRAGETLRIPVPPDAGTTAAVSVTWGGRPVPHGNYGAGLFFRVQGSTPQDPLAPAVASMSEPWSAHSWWPCKDHPSDKATLSLSVVAPDSLQVVANGVRTRLEPAGPGLSRTTWETAYPLPPYLVAVNLSRFVEWEESCAAAEGPLRLTYHVFPASEAAARYDLSTTCDMVRFLESLCGPYPFGAERYGQVEFKWGGAMEHQTCSSLGTTVLRGDGRHRDIILHELAHQWFGDKITPRVWSDIWLNEGFASYCEALWIEHEQGRVAYLERMARIGPRQHPDLFTGDGPLTDPDPILPNLLVYHKGAWILHMLRGLIGDEAFFRCLHDWANDPATAYGSVDTDGFLATASAAAGRDVDRLLRPWLDTAAVPHLAWQTRTEGLPGDRTRVTLRLRQQQTTPFVLRVPVRLVGSGGVVEDAVWSEGAVTERNWVIDGVLKGLHVDPEGWVLAARRPLPAPEVKLLPPRPNPAGADGTVLSFQLLHAGPARVELHDARGRRLGCWELGVLPAEAAPVAWRWTGVDDAGRPVPAGTYWLSVHAAGDRSTRKVVLVR
jgi:aminopeptidase N